MGASLFIGKNDELQNGSGASHTGGFVNGAYWDAFCYLLDRVFLPDYTDLHQLIVEMGYYQNFCSFAELDVSQFNLAVHLIRQHLSCMKPELWLPVPDGWRIMNMQEFQRRAQQVWKNLAEPYVISDKRYDSKFFL